MSGPTLVRTPGQPAEWKRIHEGMRKLWRLCLADEQGLDVARSLTINFLGVADAADAAALREATERLQRRSPCRAFLVLLDETATPGQAELAAVTRSHGSTRDIVLEEITLRLPTSAFGQLPGLIRPLLMNDLPNHLFWGCAWPSPEATFDAMASLCDHVVIDSRRFTQPAIDLKAVAARRAQGKRLTDLAWLRLRPWRRALAEGFERVRWQPGTPTTVMIRHGKQATAAAQLLGDWLRARLAAKVQFDTSGDATAPSPEGVVINTGGFEIELAAPRQQIRVHVTTPEHCYLPFSIANSRGQDADLLAAAIDMV